MDDLSEKSSDSNQTAKSIQMAVCKSLKALSGRNLTPNFSVIKTAGTGRDFNGASTGCYLHDGQIVW